MNLTLIVFRKKIALFYYRWKLKLSGHIKIYRRLEDLETSCLELKHMENNVLEIENKINELKALRKEAKSEN